MKHFDEKHFRKRYKKNASQAIQCLIEFLQNGKGIIELPEDLFNYPTPLKLLGVELNLLKKLEKLYVQRPKNPKLKFLIQVAHQYSRLFSSVDKFIAAIDFETLLVYCGYYYEWRRFQEGITRSDNPDTIEIINAILNRKMKSNRTDKEKLKSSPNSKSFDEKSFKILRKVVRNLKLQKHIIKNFNKIDQAHELAFLMEWSLQMESEVKSYEKGKYQLVHLDDVKLLQWFKANKKYRAQHWYDQNMFKSVFAKKEQLFQNSQLDPYTKLATVKMWTNQLKFLESRFPEQITFEDRSCFSSLNYFKLLNSLSQHANSRWNHLIEGQLVLGVGLDNALWEVIIDNDLKGTSSSLIFAKDYNKFITALLDDWDRKESETITDYLTNTLEKHSPKIDLNLRPFLKIGEVLYWFPGIIANKNYSSLLEKRLFTDSNSPKAPKSNFDHEEWTANAANYIADIFRQAGFKHTITDKKYKKPIQSDIDLAVYADDYLFIFEIKYTYGRAQINEIRSYTKTKGRAIQKAFDQLEKHLQYLSIPGNTEGLLKEMGADILPDELQIIRIILDNSFEEDGKYGEIYKISKLELEVILRNEVWLLLDQLQIQEMGEELFNLSLWSGNRCTAKDIFNNIQQGTVWKLLPGLDNYQVQDRKLNIGRMTINYRR